MTMTTRSILLRLVRRLYDEVEAALWASLVVFVIYFCAFVVPDMPQQQAKAKLVRDREIANENSHYCAKWGKELATREHMLCTMDLQELRKSVHQSLANDRLF